MIVRSGNGPLPQTTSLAVKPPPNIARADIGVGREDLQRRWKKPGLDGDVIEQATGAKLAKIGIASAEDVSVAAAAPRARKRFDLQVADRMNRGGASQRLGADLRKTDEAVVGVGAGDRALWLAGTTLQNSCFAVSRLEAHETEMVLLAVTTRCLPCHITDSQFH
jgi:hypothetical protein